VVGCSVPPAKLSEGCHLLPARPGTVPLMLETSVPPWTVDWDLVPLEAMPWCLISLFTLITSPSSPQARDRNVLGDTDGAGSYAKTAKCLNITVLVLRFLTVVLIIVLVATGVVAVSHAVQQENQNRNN
uniref:Uncharacterized protein n=1 Tax=Chrysemys picta bellii TaxID=8478 RepID=A0A8C3FXD9_CHRPI